MIEGISLWQQGRLDQEDIINVQNLASTDLLSLVVSTPFDVGQIVDWVDQAILLIYACPEQLIGLRKVGMRLASTVLKAFETDPQQLQQASGLSASELYLLHLALKPATNMGLISRYRAHKTRRWGPETSRPAQSSPSPAD